MLNKTRKGDEILENLDRDEIEMQERSLKYSGISGVEILKESLTGVDLDVVKSIRTRQFTIKQNVINKFQNRNKKKIIEFIDLYLKKGSIKVLNNETAEVDLKVYDFIIKLNFKTRIIDFIGTSSDTFIEDNSIIFNKGIPKLTNPREEQFYKFEAGQFEKQKHLLRSYIVDETKIIPKIEKGNFELKYINPKKGSYVVKMQDASFKVTNYNIVNYVSTKYLNYNEKSMPEINIKSLEHLEEEYFTYVKVIDIYKDEEKALGYFDKFGLSVKTITKFVLENNESELFDFLISDIIKFGVILYDNYMKNEMIIQTKRYVYMIKNSIIVNIKSLNLEEIEFCSIEFKKVYKAAYPQKIDILDLTNEDQLKDFVSRRSIDMLKMADHAKNRYIERVDRDCDFSMVELEIKNDLYKNGVITFGTYYKNTKLVKGYRYIYVVDNKRIISVWEQSQTLNEIKTHYLTTINEFCEHENLEMI